MPRSEKIETLLPSSVRGRSLQQQCFGLQKSVFEHCRLAFHEQNVLFDRTDARKTVAQEFKFEAMAASAK